MSTTERTSTGDLLLPRVIATNPAYVAMQGIRDVLSLWQGSWFGDTLAGFPWLQQVFVAHANDVAIQALLSEAILSVAYVVSVTASVSVNRAARAFSYVFSATLDTGEVLTGGSNQAFRVTNPDASAVTS